MSDFKKPDVVEEEIFIDSDTVIMCKTDKEGIFEFANESFMKISGYEEYELMGKSMFCIQHPDMPEVIFKMMWEKLLAKKNFHVVMKNIAKNGKFYWSYTNFEFKVDDNEEIIAIYSKRIAASRDSIELFGKLYKTLVGIESKNGIQSSEKYLNGFLEEKQMNFKELVLQFYDNATVKVPKPKKTVPENIKPKKDIVVKKEEKKEDVINKEISTTITPKEKKEDVINKGFSTTITPKEKKEVINVPKEIKKETPKKIIKENIKETKPSESVQKKEEKSLFQRLFGKTDEEIEENRKRKENN